jgi:chromosome segregation ATPase
MSQPDNNYFEIVAVPILQRKCQELFNANIVLETNLHMEIAQSKHRIEEISKLRSVQTTSVDDITSTRDKLAEVTIRAAKAENDFRNLQASLSDKGSALNTAQNKINSLEGELAESKKALQALQSELQAAKIELAETQQKFNEMDSSARKPGGSRGRPKIIGPSDDF